MSEAPVLAVRIAAVGTVALLLALLPLMSILGIAGLLVWGAAAAWYGRIGLRLWRHDPRIVRPARTTYLVTLLLGVVEILHGLLALQAAERSAARGGGLLGGYGLIPLLAGALLVLIASLSLRAVSMMAAAQTESGPAT